VRRLIALYDLWERSRTSGNILSDLWRRQVLKCVVSTICSIIGGSRWEKAEREYLEKGDEASLARLKACITDKPDERIIGAVLAKDAERLAGLSLKERQTELRRLIAPHLRDLERRHGVDRIGEVLALETKIFSTLMTCLQEYPATARAGRFLVLVVDRQCAATHDRNGCCYRGWKWR
jgi:hypothetical protein